MRVLVVGFLCLLLSGCVTNYYDKHYHAKDVNWAKKFIKGEPKDVEIRPVTTEDGVVSALEAGYIPIGTSVFVNRHCPWFCAIKKAEDVGADLVLIDEVLKGKETRTSVIFLPSYQYSYSQGSVNVNTRGYTSYGTYNGTTTTTSVSAVPVDRDVLIFEQSALFLRKGDFSEFYGAILFQPKRLPDEAHNAIVPVTVMAVLKGSQAEKDGIKRGDRVTRINGQVIHTRQDYKSFQGNPCLIQNIEVEQ